MITSAITGAGMGFAAWIVGLFPGFTPAAWMTTLPQQINDILQNFTGLGVWVDWTAVGIAFTATVTAYVVGFGIKLIRAVAAHIPFIGGSG